jgi:negative regulator of flagellin synthesis FlgM
LQIALKFSGNGPLIEAYQVGKFFPCLLRYKDDIVNIDNALDKTAEPAAALKAQQKQSTDSAAVQNTAAKAAPAESDSVRLSPQYQALAKSVANSSSFNADKVASIKAAIANGEFTVDAGKIADGVLATARDLINSHRAA